MTRLEILDEVVNGLHKKMREALKSKTATAETLKSLQESLTDALNEHREECKYIRSQGSTYVTPYTQPYWIYTTNHVNADNIGQNYGLTYTTDSTTSNAVLSSTGTGELNWEAIGAEKKA